MVEVEAGKTDRPRDPVAVSKVQAANAAAEPERATERAVVGVAQAVSKAAAAHRARADLVVEAVAEEPARAAHRKVHLPAAARQRQFRLEQERAAHEIPSK